MSLDLNLCPACQHEKHVGRVCQIVKLTDQGLPTHEVCGCDDAKARKADSGKVGGFSLIPWNVLAGLADIYDYGRKKYAANSWQTVPPDEHGRTAEERYEDAMFRHWGAYKRGEWLDPESKKPHLFHFLWGAVAMCWFGMKRRQDEGLDRQLR